VDPSRAKAADAWKATEPSNGRESLTSSVKANAATPALGRVKTAERRANATNRWKVKGLSNGKGRLCSAVEGNAVEWAAAERATPPAESERKGGASLIALHQARGLNIMHHCIGW
jgi:hypothetical protein